MAKHLSSHQHLAVAELGSEHVAKPSQEIVLARAVAHDGLLHYALQYITTLKKAGLVCSQIELNK